MFKDFEVRSFHFGFVSHPLVPASRKKGRIVQSI